jgi:hypothetical protein
MAKIAIGLFPLPVAAQPLAFFGDIGGTPIFVSLDRNGGKLSGWYLYINQATQIRLEGSIDAANFALDEFSFENGRKTGSFKGTPGEAAWLGTWQSAEGRQLKLTLRQNRDASSSLNARVHCKARFTDSGYTFLYSLDLQATKGRVTRLSLSSDVTGWNEEHGCSIDLSDLRQVPSDAGVLLRAKEDDEKDTSEGAQHCALRILGDDNYLYVHVDGCKGAGDTMFCSTRGSLTDLVVNRKAQTCKAVR